MIGEHPGDCDPGDPRLIRDVLHTGQSDPPFCSILSYLMSAVKSSGLPPKEDRPLLNIGS